MSYVTHWSALVPLLYLLYKGDAQARYWLVALGFSVSFFADALVYFVPQVNWAVTHFYPPLQLGLFALACGSVLVPSLLTLGAFMPTGLDRPEVVWTTLGSVMVLQLARSEPFALSLYIYCGAATVFYLLLSSRDANFMTWWYGYQSCRIAAFMLFIRSARYGHT